jgi:hypothetical protein
MSPTALNIALMIGLAMLLLLTLDSVAIRAYIEENHIYLRDLSSINLVRGCLFRAIYAASM